MTSKARRKGRTEPLATERETIKCAFCRGTGIDPFPVLSPKSNCVVCHGRGVVRVPPPYVTCQRCRGTGVYFGSHMYCWTCRGKGVVHTKKGAA